MPASLFTQKLYAYQLIILLSILALRGIFVAITSAFSLKDTRLPIPYGMVLMSEHLGSHCVTLNKHRRDN